METPPDADDTDAIDSTPGAILDALRDHPDWDDARREALFDRLIAGFDPEALRAAARPRLIDLSSDDAEAVLRLVEADPTGELLGPLAEALAAQPGLPPERAWEAIGLLQGSEWLDRYPELAERFDEISELLDEAPSLDELAAQINEDPDGAWIALHGLSAVEPEVRAEIVAGLAAQPARPGLVAFLRLLTFTHEPATRDAALEALSGLGIDAPEVAAAWERIAAEHADPAVVARARAELGEKSTGTGLVPLPSTGGPRLRRALITAVDGTGRADVVLAAQDRGDWVAAAFVCDLLAGVVDVIGHVGPDEGAAAAFVAEFAARPERDAIEGPPELALALLAGSLTLCGPQSPPALRYWLERTAGPGLRPHPFVERADEPTAAADTHAAMAEQARLVLETCPGWIDDSPLTYDLAEEIALRWGDAPPDPTRDSGAFRFLFEHRLRARLELDRRMLLWMAPFWQASGSPELADAARALARQLSDPQHVVPGHPYLVALARRSLRAAQVQLLSGIDPRNLDG